MTIYKIVTHNKTDKSINLKLVDCNGNQSLKDLGTDDSHTHQTDSTIANLYIFENSKELWSGSVPSDTKLEIYKENNKIEVYLENDRIPPYVIQNLKCSENKNKPNKSLIFMIILIAILCGSALYISYSKSKRKK